MASESEKTLEGISKIVSEIPIQQEEFLQVLGIGTTSYRKTKQNKTNKQKPTNLLSVEHYYFRLTQNPLT